MDQPENEAIFDTEDDLHPTGRSTGSWTGGRWILLILLIASAAFAIHRFIGPRSAMAGWEHDWDKALNKASTTGKPMLVLFTADWCPPCRSLKSDVFSDSKVSSYLQGEFSLMKVDLSDRNDVVAGSIAQTYNVRSIPTLICFDANGQQVDRMSGAGDKGYMMSWFTTAAAKAGR